MTEQMTGAQALVRALEHVGVDTCSGSRAARSCPPTTRSTTRPRSGTCWSGTSRAPGTPPRATPQATGQGRRLHRHLAGRARPTWSPPIADAHMDSVPHGRDHRPGGRAADRHRRLPGGRHLAASRCRSPSTTSWSPTRPTSRRRSREAFHIASTGPSRPGAGRHHQGRAAGARRRSSGRRSVDLPGYRPVTKAARQADPRGRQADRRRAERPVLYVGGGVHPGPSAGRSCSSSPS